MGKITQFCTWAVLQGVGAFEQGSNITREGIPGWMGTSQGISTPQALCEARETAGEQAPPAQGLEPCASLEGVLKSGPPCRDQKDVWVGAVLVGGYV